MARRDYYHDPNAPTPNSLVVATNVFVQDEHGRVLLIQRSDNGMWALPGGAMEIGETVAQCGQRETLEETGYTVHVTAIIGIYSDPAHVIAYDNGEIRQQFAVVLRAQLESGEARTSDETPELAWVSEHDLASYPMQPWIRLRIQHGMEQTNEPPYLG